MKRDLTTDEQLARLRAASRSPVLRRPYFWMALLAFVAASATAATGSLLLLAVASLFAILGVVEKRAHARVERCLETYDTGAPTVGLASILVTRSEYGEALHVIVDSPGHGGWRYEFVPRGWTPRPGPRVAKIWFQADSGVPALAIIDPGLLVPRNEPVRIDSRGAGDSPWPSSDRRIALS